jgi:hypothetical protein
MWPSVLFSARTPVCALLELNLYALLDDYLAIHDHPVARNGQQSPIRIGIDCLSHIRAINEICG